MVFRQIDRVDSDRLFNDHDHDEDKQLSWDETLKFFHGYTIEELKKLIDAKDAKALSIDRVCIVSLSIL